MCVSLRHFNLEGWRGVSGIKYFFWLLFLFPLSLPVFCRTLLKNNTRHSLRRLDVSPARPGCARAGGHIELFVFTIVPLKVGLIRCTFLHG